MTPGEASRKPGSEVFADVPGCRRSRITNRRYLRYHLPMPDTVTSLFRTPAVALPVGLAFLLLLILVISFWSRAIVFCQYLFAMTGIRLSPSDVRRVFRQRGREGVREFFLDLIIREDLKEGPLQIPEEEAKLR